jgi:cytosine permease
LLILIAKTCWFAIQLNMMVLSIQEIFQLKTDIVITLLLGGCILACAWKGLRALSMLSSITLPLLVATMAAAMILAEKRGETNEIQLLSMGSISIAIGAAITAVIDMPTYFRHARSIKDGLIAVAILFAFSIPLIEMIGVYLAYQNPALTVTETLMNPQSFLWNLWITLFLLLAGWTTNNTNLYSASVCLESIWKGLSEKLRLTLVSGMGILLASAHVLDHLGLFLQMLGIFVGSMGAVILVNFLAASKGTTQVKMSIISWILGVLIGLLNLFHVVDISPIAVLDAFLIAGTSTLLGRCYEISNCRSTG